MTDPTARALRLLSLLQTYKFWSGDELAAQLEVSPRTLRRDVDRLRELGYPVDATPGANGGYRLAAGAHLPPLLLDDDEAVAIAVGLRAAAGASIEGIEETSVRALAEARTGPARPVAAPGERGAHQRVVDAMGCRHRDRRRRRAGRARVGVSRQRAGPLRLSPSRRRRSATPRRAAQSRLRRAALVPRRVGTCAGKTGERSGSTGSTHRGSAACGSVRANCRPRTRPRS